MNRQNNMISSNSPRRAADGDRCPQCRGEGSRPSPGAAIEYDRVHDETYGYETCPRCEGTGEFPDACRLYECPESMTCGVLVDGATLRTMIEMDLPCRCGAPGRHFNLLPREDEPHHDEWPDALWTVEEIQGWKEVG